MKHFDEFSRPEEYISPFDKHFRRVIRKHLDEWVMPERRKYDEDWKDHHLIEPAFDKLMAELGLQKALFPQEYGGWGLANPIMSSGWHTCSARNLAGPIRAWPWPLPLPSGPCS